ncbi:hypothetical protein cce_3847 [Crocosphaera subtropica ATCC 51142]|uniref:Uncharacterized protein n=1 Tax=Crocosphaera subtropica (strain ATCC 51142 / BH68) TaxID=43989 RepID=B1WP16_CROS5|nr:hypothetical protein cce_3847 [Crocosphaera subtropica ATCC 51142]
MPTLLFIAEWFESLCLPLKQSLTTPRDCFGGIRMINEVITESFPWQ